MVPHIAVFSLVMFSLLAGTPAQRSPYLGSSDPGVLPQYLPPGTEDRFGGGGDQEAPEPPKIHNGTLETEDVYNRVAQWPDAHKPFWYLNAVAIQRQREQQQAQAQAQAGQVQPTQTRSPFASSTGRRAQQNN